MSLNWGGNVVQMPPPIWTDEDFKHAYEQDKPSGPRMLTNALVIAFCVALGIAVCVWRFR